MSPDLTFALIVLAPVAVLMLLRVNAALVFLSLCLGNVLVEFVAEDAGDLAIDYGEQVPQLANAGSETISLLLLLTPVVLTTIFMIRTVRGHGRLLMNALPAAGVGLLGALLVVPLLPIDLSFDISDSGLWELANNFKEVIVGGSAVVCMVVLWTQRPKTGGGLHRKHKS